MRFLVLGPLEVIAGGGEPLPIAGSKERSMLADMIAHAGRVVSVDELIVRFGVSNFREPRRRPCGPTSHDSVARSSVTLTAQRVTSS